MSTSVATRSSTQTSCSVMAMTVSQAVQYVMMWQFKVCAGRGLNIEPLTTDAKGIQAGILTWMCLRQLRGLRIEAHEGNEVIERWTLDLNYNPNPITPGTTLPCTTNTEAFEKVLAGMEKLPPGTAFRIVAMLPPDAVDVPGWTQAGRLDDSKLVHQDLGPAFDFHHILGKLGLAKR